MGRVSQLGRARELLGSARLVTLVGPGGVGKTRLSRELGSRVLRAFPDGVWLVEFADLRDGRLVALSVVEALHLRDDAASPRDQLLTFLADKTALLIVDNCEHLIHDVAHLVADILAAAPRVKVLATSREMLGVPGEQVMVVPPLAVASSGGGDSEAVQLLLDRAGAASAAFDPDLAERETLDAICRRVDGIPLALELIALRTTLFTPRQILARLDDALGLLTAGARTAAVRQQTLDNAIRWSYELCTAEEVRLWEVLSVFAGGLDLDAAEAVAGAAAGDTARALAGLVNKSVLTMTNVDGIARYSMLEPLRQFGRHQLQARGDADAVLAAHRRYFADLARAGIHAYGTGEDWQWLTAVARDHANIRAALQDSLRHDRVLALEVAAVLRPFWEHYRFISEGFQWLSQALAANPEPTHLRARGLVAAASLAALLSEHAEAGRLTHEAAQLAADLGDEMPADVHLCRALVAVLDRNFPAALQLSELTADTAARAGDSTLEMEGLALGYVAALVIEDLGASALARRLTTLTIQHGPHMLGGLAWWIAGLDHWRGGDPDAADADFARAARLFSSFGRCVWLASVFEGMSWTAATRGDHARAATLIGASESLERSSIRLVEVLTGPIGAATREQVRAALGDAGFDDSFAAGAELGVEAAIEFALTGSSHTSPAPGDHQRDSVAADPSSHRNPRLAVAGDPGVNPLTRRQSEVAQLVARGYSNKEIASALVLSQRTVETHVEHILVRLGFTRRTEIARWVHTQPQ
ncbi:LuxR family transcriptional regulator [Nocardia tengchongensis]